jgi:ribosome-associated protein
MSVIAIKTEQLLEIKDLIISSLEDDKCDDIAIIDLEGKTEIAKFMIIATGRSDRQIRAMADHIVQKMKELNVASVVEGMDSKDWVLVDIFDIIIHIFTAEARREFNLESLWR